MHTIVSDKTLHDEFVACLRKRSIDQKFFYIDEWADNYYNACIARKENEIKEQKFVEWTSSSLMRAEIQNIVSLYPDANFFADFMINRSYWKYKAILVGLWCWDSSKEKWILKKLKKKWIDVPYFAVDTSSRMLELSKNNLKDISQRKTFLRADIMSKDFKDALYDITIGIDIRVLAFLGGTFCNPNQTEIAESIYNLMGENDLLWVDMKTRDEITEENEEILMNKYLWELDNDALFDKNFNVLKKIWISPTSWRLKLAVWDEPHVWSKLFKYYFQFNEDVKVEYSWEKISFLKDEWIMLQHIRVYHKQTFLDFMEKMWFVLIDQMDSKKRLWISRSQFLFKKED